jgi:transposase
MPANVNYGRDGAGLLLLFALRRRRRTSTAAVRGAGSGGVQNVERGGVRRARSTNNGTIHRGEKVVARLQGTWPNVVLVHLPRHASWLNQIEICFSILARKALTPAHFHNTDEVAERVLGFPIIR